MFISQKAITAWEKRQKRKKPRWEWNIACSRWVMFRRKDRGLLIKMFVMTLDDYLKHSKKSHWIKLQCRWKNMGCKPGKQEG